MTYYSEYGQDQYIHSLMPHKNGVFVEIGALDGVLHSNTLFFEKEQNWRGIIIEANPVFYQSIVTNRPNSKVLACAVSDKPGIGQFTVVESCLGWSGLTAEIEPKHMERIASTPQSKQSIGYVPTLDLGSILGYFGLADIDYMSIDVEGAEEKILNMVFLMNTKVRIKVLSVEDNWFRPGLITGVQFGGYRFLRKIGPDLVFHHDSWIPPA